MLSNLTHRPISKPIAGAAVLLCALGTLSACGSSGSSSGSSNFDSAAANKAAAGACDNVKPGATSSGVKVAGAFGKTVTANFTKPLKATALQRTVAKRGTGAATKKGEQVNAVVTVYSGAGKALGSEPLTLSVGSASIPKAFAAGVACLPLGSRSVVTDSAKDVYGAQGNPQLGLKASDAMVIVTDLVSEKKPLVPSKWTSNHAKVTFHGTKPPKVVLPKTAPPKQLEVQVLKQGTGATVGTGDSVTLEYQGTTWSNGKVFDQSYGKAPATFSTDQVVPGFGAALVGQKVGTKLVVSIPPQDAYGPKSSSQPLGGQTLVFVIEIQKAASAG